MQIFKIETPSIKLDGGALFGVIPKWMWKNKYSCDDNNCCNCAVRSLLIVDGDRVVLIDTGVGTKHSSKDLAYGFDQEYGNLEKNILKAGYKPEDITDVILTHLHFDHCGGILNYDKNNNLAFAFPNAIHHISTLQWNNAINPNYREKASYLRENIELLIDSKKLNLINRELNITKNIYLQLYDGHTEGLLVPIINYNGREIAFPGDLLPILPMIPLAWVSAYDVRPLKVIDEKKKFLEESIKNDRIVIFQHDYYNECCTLKETPKGIRADKIYKIKDVV